MSILHETSEKLRNRVVASRERSYKKAERKLDKTPEGKEQKRSTKEWIKGKEHNEKLHTMLGKRNPSTEDSRRDKVTKANRKVIDSPTARSLQLKTYSELGKLSKASDLRNKLNKRDKKAGE